MEIPHNAKADVEDSLMIAFYQLSKGFLVALLGIQYQNVIADIHNYSAKTLCRIYHTIFVVDRFLLHPIILVHHFSKFIHFFCL
jgi:hypothetical protein